MTTWNADVLTDLAGTYGTPLYVYQLDAVRAAATSLAEALPEGVRVYYSVKANPHPVIVSTLLDCGTGLEISSAGELEATGTRQAPRIYTGPGKTADEIAEAVHAGVRLFSVESRTERDRLAATARQPVDFLLRLNPQAAHASAGLRMTGGPSQFGVDMATLRQDTELLTPSPQARPIGFHTFSATNLTTEDALLTELRANVAAVSEAVRLTGLRPELIDIGGGFAAPYMVPGEPVRYTRLCTEIASTLDAEFSGWRGGEPVVAVESGRYLTAASGVLLTTVLDVKPSGSSTYLVCDAGINVLGGMYGTGRLVAPKAQPAGQPPDAPAGVLVGPLCTPLDVLGRAARVADPRVGQVLVIPNVGAYGLTASLVAFLGRPIAGEVVLDGTDVVSARRLELRAEVLR